MNHSEMLLVEDQQRISEFRRAGQLDKVARILDVALGTSSAVVQGVVLEIFGRDDVLESGRGVRPSEDCDFE